jgi:hypothetical protein
VGPPPPPRVRLAVIVCLGISFTLPPLWCLPGAMLAQSQFESRLRAAYRSMLLQLQHRYQLERERQEEAHQAALREQVSEREVGGKLAPARVRPHYRYDGASLSCGLSADADLTVAGLREERLAAGSITEGGGCFRCAALLLPACALRPDVAAQEEEHAADFGKLAAAHDGDLAEAARRMERRDAEWRAEVQRLEVGPGAR